MPTLMSASTTPALNGITAHAIKARTKVTIGAIKNTTLFAPVGTMVSLSTILMRSAKDCRRPKGPTTLGPRRSWAAAITLRSAQTRYATTISSGSTIASTLAAMMTVGQA